MADEQDTNTDPETRTLEQTQATTPDAPPGVFTGQPVYTEDGGVSNLRRNPETGELYDPGGQAGYAVAPGEPGSGAYDDNPQPTTGATGGTNQTTSGTSQNLNDLSKPKTVNGTFNENSRRPIVPQPNVLAKFSSYTWRASVYLMSSEQYQSLLMSRKKNISGFNLLFQSGGAPTTTLGSTQGLAGTQGNAPNVPNQAIPGRNPAFDVDFYIDSITITNMPQGKATGAAHSIVNLKFTVVEPYGITLIDRIYQAVQQVAPVDASGKGINYANAHYLMVLRWYGYDADGNQVQVGAADPKTGLTDPNAVVEKFIPFTLNSINWTVSSKSTTYQFDGSAIDQLVSAGTRRGVVPYDVQFSASSVKDMLDGRAAFRADATTATGQGTGNQRENATTQAPAAGAGTAPPKATAATQATRTVTGGLMAALTQYQKELTQGPRPIFEQYDEYYIEFTPRAQAIASARLVIPGNTQEAKTTATKPPPGAAGNSLNPQTDAKQNQVKTLSIVAGQPIVQIIDRVIRNSTYITEQQLTQIDDRNDEVPNPNARNKPVNWFSIRFRAEPKKYDFLRNDYAYKITYIIDMFPLDKYDSKYFPLGTFRGVHKSYPWWFTGKNTEVIEYSESLNTSYNMLVTGTTPQNSAAESYRRKVAASMRDLYTYTWGPGSDETRQGADSKTFEGAANLADSLYGGADLGIAKIKILGDPAWIQQSNLASGISVEDLEYGSFLPDGTINLDGEQPMFEVTWNRPSDYNINTGLQDVLSGQKNISRVYMATEVVSEFKQGKFEQNITGALYQLPKPDGTNRAPTAPQPVPKNRESGNVTEATQARTGVDLTNTRAGGGRGFGYQGAGGNVTEATQARTGVDLTNTRAGGGRGAGTSLYPQQPMKATTPPYNDFDIPTTPVNNNQQTPNIQPQPAPEAPTSGTGENVSWYDAEVNPVASQKINQADFEPSTPQDMARDA